MPRGGENPEFAQMFREMEEKAKKGAMLAERNQEVKVTGEEPETK